MNHPDLDRLTAWVHELLEPADRRPLEEHAAECAECRDLVERLHEEARALAAEIAPEPRLSALKQALLQPPRPRNRGLLWQVPLAAAVLFGLLAVLLSPGPRHRLTAGRVALEDGREVSAPVDFAGSRSWNLRAVDRASVRLSEGSTVELQPGSWIGLEARGERGVQARLATGEAAFAVAPDPRRLTVCSEAGRIESTTGRFTVKIVFEDEGGTPMKGMIAGALVTVLAGSASLANAQGTASVEPGRAAVLARTEAPLLLAAPQDAEALLKRLEQLVARVAKLEEEIGRLEARNKQLKEQLKSNAAGGGVWFGGNGAGGARVIQPGPGSSVILELDERKPEKKDR